MKASKICDLRSVRDVQDIVISVTGRGMGPRDGYGGGFRGPGAGSGPLGGFGGGGGGLAGYPRFRPRLPAGMQIKIGMLMTIP